MCLGRKYFPNNVPNTLAALILSKEQFAMTVASYTLTRLAQRFREIETRDPEPWIEAISFTLTSQNGVKVALSPSSDGAGC